MTKGAYSKGEVISLMMKTIKVVESPWKELLSGPWVKIILSNYHFVGQDWTRMLTFFHYGLDQRKQNLGVIGLQLQ